MRVQLDNTKQNFIYLSETSKFKKTIVALKLIFGKILLDKDWPFFCPHINAITTTLRILFIFWWFAKLRVSDRAGVLKYQLECGKVQWLQTHCGQALIFLGQITVQRYVVFVSTVELRTLYIQELPYMNTFCECILKKIRPTKAHFQYNARKLMSLKSVLLWGTLQKN